MHLIKKPCQIQLRVNCELNKRHCKKGEKKYFQTQSGLKFIHRDTQTLKGGSIHMQMCQPMSYWPKGYFHLANQIQLESIM